MSGYDRFSQSSYGDPRYLSSASFGAPAPPTKVLMDGYRDAQHAEKARYNPLNPTRPRSPALVNSQDPVAMYLLTETAIGDSMNYEILSLEEVEDLKKEHTFLSRRMDAAKRKLALEMKLRDAAISLSRLNNPKSPRASDEYDFGQSVTLDKTDDELALTMRKCEELTHEVWKLENRVQQINKRLLEHTAGILQMTHKGLKKNAKDNVPHTPESLSSHNTRDSIDEFDDRSLYKLPNHLDELGGYGRQGAGNHATTIGLDAIHSTEKKLEDLSMRMRDMVLQSNPDSDLDPIPQPSSNGGPVNPTATVEAHLAYIGNGLGLLTSHPGNASRALGSDLETGKHLQEINTRLHDVLGHSGLSRPQTLSPPDSSNGMGEQLSYLNSNVDDLQKQVEKLIEQKSILTTQIQQQRELNSKSDAERDAHIADLIEQMAHIRKELELSEREGQKSKEGLEIAWEELESVRQDLADHQQKGTAADELTSEREARARAEAEISRLEIVMEELQEQRDTQAEAHEARVRAEDEASRLETHLEELAAARSQADNEIARLQGVIDQLHHEADARAEEIVEARDRADQVSQLEQTMQQIREEADAQVKEASSYRAQAESEISRLEASMEQLRTDLESQLREATEARAHAEENATRSQEELTQMEGDVVRLQTELTMAKAELDGAYGSRSQRAAEVAANPAIQKEFEHLTTRNIELTEELATLKAGRPGSSETQRRVETLERELRETIDDYESMTKASIEFEKERERYEGMIDGLRDRCEQLETQLNEERINWMGLNNAVGETTSTMVLKNEFKKMMRDTRMENMKIIKAEQEERRRLEILVRNMKKEHANINGKSSLSQSVTA